MTLEKLSSYHGLKQWSVFSTLEDHILRQVRLAYVFGPIDASGGILVTKDDVVYSVGYGLNGVKLTSPTSMVLLDKLSREGCVKFSATVGTSLFGLTADGRIFGWGNNRYSQLGPARTSTPSEPMEIKVGEEGEIPGPAGVDVACGGYFSVALSAQGDIFVWGTKIYRASGQAGAKTHTRKHPAKLSAPNKIVSVACGYSSIVALTSTGTVLCWENDMSEWFMDPYTPTMLSNKIVTKVAAGKQHFLALTETNRVFCWGKNTHGQLGTNSMTQSTVGEKVRSSSNCFVDIAAANSSNISMALDSKGLIHIWGELRGGSSSQPFAAQFDSFSSAFCCLSNPPVMPQPVEIMLPTAPTLLDSINQMFDDQETSDLKFVDQMNAVHVHKAILVARSNHFKMMFGNGWKESGQSELPIPTPFTFSVYQSFLRYIYTDEVIVAGDDIIQLLCLTNYVMDSVLGEKCSDILVQRISVENGAAYFQASLLYGDRTLEDKCFKFCVQHLKEVTATEGYANLDKETLNRFIGKMALLNVGALFQEN